MQLGAWEVSWGGVGGGSPGRSAVGPRHASEPVLCESFPSCLCSRTPLPLIPDAGALRSVWNDVLRT